MQQSNYQVFWGHRSFAVVGHLKRGGFPRLTYQGLKQRGKTVFPVDPSAGEIDGDTAYPDLASLPTAVEAVVLEVRKEETEGWVEQAAANGIRNVWIHQNRETPEALERAELEGLDVKTGTCAVVRAVSMRAGADQPKTPVVLLVP